MCIDFNAGAVWIEIVYSITSKPTQSSSRRVSSFKDSSALLSGELRKREVLLIASTLFVVKTENIYRNTRKMHLTMETELCL